MKKVDDLEFFKPPMTPINKAVAIRQCLNRFTANLAGGFPLNLVKSFFKNWGRVAALVRSHMIDIDILLQDNRTTTETKPLTPNQQQLLISKLIKKYIK